MSSSFMNSSKTVDVSNMMFWRVHDFALHIAREKKVIPKYALQKFEGLEYKYGRTPDIDIEEEFSIEELKIWADIFKELANRIFKREIGNHDNNEWQVWTIWAACSMSQLFNVSFRNKKNNG